MHVWMTTSFLKQAVRNLNYLIILVHIFALAAGAGAYVGRNREPFPLLVVHSTN